MLTVICVLKSGGNYNAEWVAKLQRGVTAHLPIEHRFVCLTDMKVRCESIPLMHDWPGWWSKIELFRPGVITAPALYIDLDNVIVRDITPLTKCKHDFAMLPNFNREQYASSCVMWFGKQAPHTVYNKFRANPAGWIKHHEDKRDGPYLGDQAFISDCFGGVPRIELPKLTVVSYRKHVQKTGELPESAAMVAFGGSLKPNTINTERWLRAAWV